MCLVCECRKNNNYFRILHIETLDCSFCEKVQEIPIIHSLKILYCEGCSNLRKIGRYNSLLELDCRMCPELEEIGPFPVIKDIDCWNCPKLKKIHHSPLLKSLGCGLCNSLLEIPNVQYDELFLWSNPFMNHSKNLWYSNNVKLLTVLQKFVRKHQKYRRFQKYTNSKEFIEWIYAPERIGGKLSKRNMQLFIDQTKAGTL